MQDPEVRNMNEKNSKPKKKSSGCFGCKKKNRNKDDSSKQPIEQIPKKSEKEDKKNKDDSSKNKDKSLTKSEKVDKKNKDDSSKKTKDKSHKKSEKEDKKNKDDSSKKPKDKSPTKDKKVSKSKSKNNKSNKIGNDNQSPEATALIENGHSPPKEIEEDMILLTSASTQMACKDGGDKSINEDEMGDHEGKNSDSHPGENIQDTLRRKRREFFANGSKSVIETVQKRNSYHGDSNEERPIKKRILSDIPKSSEPIVAIKYIKKDNDDVVNHTLEIDHNFGDQTDGYIVSTSIPQSYPSSDNQEIVGKDCSKVQITEDSEPEQPQWEPTGFSNPVGYCYLNTVIQILLSCEDFTNEFLAYDKWDPSETNDDSLFVKGLFDLFYALKTMDRHAVELALEIVQYKIQDSSFGDDIYKCFMNILTRISDVMKDETARAPQSSPIEDKAVANFIRFKNKNPGFVFDNFYGQLAFQTVCKICHDVTGQSFQMIKALPLPVPTSDTPVPLKQCLDLFFADSEMYMDDKIDCKCLGGSMSVKSVTRITNCPKYLFIYLNRGVIFEGGEKNNTHVSCDKEIEIKTSSNEKVHYKLISVADHMGDVRGGHYYCKCSYEKNTWWLLSDTQVTRLVDTDEMVSKGTIVFLFKKLEKND